MKVRVRFLLTGLAHEHRAAYRRVRHAGMPRYEANLMIVGAVMATGGGEIALRRPHRQSNPLPSDEMSIA